MFKKNESPTPNDLVNTVTNRISDLRKKNREELNYNQSMDIAPLRSMDDFVLARARFQVSVAHFSSHCHALIFTFSGSGDQRWR